MQETRPAGNEVWRFGAGRRVLLASLSMFALVSAAEAQQRNLRGGLTETEIQRQLEAGATSDAIASDLPDQAGIPSRRYEPVSPGAVPDEANADDGLFPFEPGDGNASGSPATSRRASAASRTNQPRGTTNDRATRAGAARTAGARGSLAGDETGRTDAPEPAATAIEGVDTLRTGRIDALDEEANRRTRSENARLDAIETGTADPEENPYAPLGLRLGTFDAYVTLDQGLRWSSNVAATRGGQEGTVSQSELRLNAISDWAQHSAEINAFGTFQKSVAGEDYEETVLGIDGALALELANETILAATAAYQVGPEGATSPIVIPDTVDDPLNHQLSASLGIRRGVGKVQFGLTGRVERESFSDADLVAGGTLSQEDRNFTLSTLSLRTGYEISPALTPFVQGEVGRRVYDLDQDSSGYERSADRLVLRGGVELDLREKLNGELSAGWLRESFDDDRLDEVSALLLEGALTWSPWRETLVRLGGTTTVEGSTTANDSGSVLYAGTLEVTRNVRQNLTVGALAGIAWRDYVSLPDDETTLSVEGNATWWLNRYVGINGRLRHERFTSTLPDRDYDASSVYLGLKLQR